MHLNVGPEAREMVLPDEETSRALGAVYAVEGARRAVGGAIAVLEARGAGIRLGSVRGIV